jgi:hypothetical protein
MQDDQQQQPTPPQQPPGKPAPRTSKARRTQLAQQERARALEQRMWQVPAAGSAAAPADAAPGARKRVRRAGEDSGPEGAMDEETGQAEGEAGPAETPRDPVGDGPRSGPGAEAGPAPPSVVRALEARLATAVRQATVSLLDMPTDARTADTVSVGTRRKFGHPLDRWPQEVELWIEDEAAGSLSQLARLNLGLPHDTWARAAWRASMATEHAVLSMPIRHRRRLYTLMRHITEPTAAGAPERDGLLGPEGAAGGGGGSFVALAASTADHLVPELGITLGQLSVFHILHARTQYVRKMDLDAHLAATGLMGPHARAGPIATDVLVAAGGGSRGAM